MSKDLISIIVPIYNIDRYVGLCIESISNQTYPYLEIILIDDGSTDRSADICDLYAKKDKRIKVIHKTNGGLVSARKAGIENSTGRYVGYVDGDDYVEPTYYERLYKAIASNDADVAISGFSRDLFDKAACLLNNISADVYVGERLESLKSRYISYGSFYKNGITTYVWNKLFKRDLLTRFQVAVNNDITIGEDAAVVYPLLAHCDRVVITDDVGYHYRQREDSMLKTSKPFASEAIGLKKLYRYLTETLGAQIEQVNDFILAQCIIRSGGITDEFCPYEKNFKDKSIVLFSAGTFGQQLVKRITENNYCNIVNWVDDDYREYRRCCLNVDSPDMLAKAQYDYILLATVDSVSAQRYKDILIGMGVDSNRVLSVSCRKEERASAIEKYLSEGG